MDYNIRKRRKLRVRPSRLLNGQMIWVCFIDRLPGHDLRLEYPGVGVTPQVALTNWGVLNPRIRL